MIQLTREVRFSLTSADDQPQSEVANSWAGAPSTDRLAPYLTLRCTMSGRIDRRTGYFCNVKRIDELLRQRVVSELIERHESAGGPMYCTEALEIAWTAMRGQLPPNSQLEKIQLKPTPFLFYERRREDTMIRVTQQFEFSASHRLHCSHLSDEENVALFGKCNNPHGHGHNYRIDIVIAAEPDSSAAPSISIHDMEVIVKREIIDRFDHKHLNLDTAEFADLNPTVENIAIVIWQLLEPHFGSGRLECVRVFETPKTWAEYFGDRAPVRDS